MPTKRSSVVKFVASLVACGCLLGVSAANAATFGQSKAPREDSERQSKLPGEAARPHMRPMAGPAHQTSLKSFLQSLQKDGVGYCESGCCYASGCDSVSCSDVSCSATCGDSFASYTC